MDATPAPSEPQADDEDAPIVEDVTPAPSEPLSYVEAQKAFFRARRDASRNPAAREHQERL